MPWMKPSLYRAPPARRESGLPEEITDPAVDGRAVGSRPDHLQGHLLGGGHRQEGGAGPGVGLPLHHRSGDVAVVAGGPGAREEVQDDGAVGREGAAFPARGDPIPGPRPPRWCGPGWRPRRTSPAPRSPGACSEVRRRPCRWRYPSLPIRLAARVRMAVASPASAARIASRIRRTSTGVLMARPGRKGSGRTSGCESRPGTGTPGRLRERTGEPPRAGRPAP